MTRRTALLGALAFVGVKAQAQQRNPKAMPPDMTDGNAKSRPSPHEIVSAEAGNAKITISYGRPYLKGRHLGDPMAPFDKVWRLGADEATKITVTGPVSFENGPKLAVGSYSVFAIPRADSWTMIVNKVADQWGAFQYDQAQDLGRFELPVKQLSAPVEEFTIQLQRQDAKSARIAFSWDKASVSTTLKAE